MSPPQAFQSYTRRDDEFFGGAITAFRRSLEGGVQVVTGDVNFEIFQDVEGVQLGQQWERRLKDAITDAIFLIPIITPLFFASAACRDELAKFIKHEESLDRGDLISWEIPRLCRGGSRSLTYPAVRAPAIRC